MKFMPMYRDSLEVMKRLSYEERGRLVTAMLAYFFDDGDPEEIATGREEVLLGLMMSRLDANKENARKLSEIRSKARKTSVDIAEQMISNDIKCEQNDQMISNDIKSQEMTPKKNKNKNKEKEEDKDKDIYKGGYKGEKKGEFDAVFDEANVTDSVKSALESFVKMRKSIKKPMTAYALKLLIGRLKKLSTDEDTQIEILNQSILHSWQDVYALKDSGTGQYTHSRDKPYNAATDYEQRNYSDDDLNKYFIDLSSVKGSDTG